MLLGAVKEKDALEFAFAYLSQDGKTVTFEKWKDFVNMASLVSLLLFVALSNVLGRFKKRTRF